MDEIIRIIESGDEEAMRAYGIEKVIKKTGTELRAARADNPAMRHRPGATLITYTHVDVEGRPVEETRAHLQEHSVIASNGPVYDAKTGKEIRGRYDETGTFILESQGPDVLLNEYALSYEEAHERYGFAGIGGEYRAHTPSYRWMVPQAMQEIPGVPMRLEEGGAVVFSVVDGKVRSWRALAPQFLATYERCI